MKIKTKKNKTPPIVLSENQVMMMLHGSINNLIFMDVEYGDEGPNCFHVVLGLDTVVEEILEGYSPQNIPESEEERLEILQGLMVPELEHFVVGYFDGSVREDEVNERIWGIQLAICEHNVNYFLEALDQIESFWSSLDDEENEVSQEPSKNSTLVKGNETVN